MYILQNLGYLKQITVVFLSFYGSQNCFSKINIFLYVTNLVLVFKISAQFSFCFNLLDLNFIFICPSNYLHYTTFTFGDFIDPQHFITTILVDFFSSVSLIQLFCSSQFNQDMESGISWPSSNSGRDGCIHFKTDTLVMNPVRG